MTVVPRLLVVDDEQINHELVAGMLRPQGWAIDYAANGRSAVEKVKDNVYDLILMDIQMPELDGYAATAEIRSGGGRSRAVPIIAFTSLKREDPDGHFKAAGMDGYLAKPFHADSLVTAVGQWCPCEALKAKSPLRAIFSQEELAKLFGRFRAQLIDAVENLDKPVEDRQLHAHRLAGLAGTLGFQSVYDVWLPLSEGHMEGIETARIEARKAIMSIDVALSEKE